MEDQSYRQHWHGVLESHLLDYLNQCQPTDLLNMVVGDVEKIVIRITLNHCGNNQSRAARVLGISRTTLNRKLNL